MWNAPENRGTAALVLQVLIEEQLAENAARLGPIFRQELMNIGSPLIQGVSGWVADAKIVQQIRRGRLAVGRGKRMVAPPRHMLEGGGGGEAQQEGSAPELSKGVGTRLWLACSHISFIVSFRFPPFQISF